MTKQLISTVTHNTIVFDIYYISQEEGKGHYELWVNGKRQFILDKLPG